MWDKNKEKLPSQCSTSNIVNMEKNIKQYGTRRIIKDCSNIE